MNNAEFEKHLATAQEALRSFIATLLGSEAPLHLEEADDVSFDAANTKAPSHIVILGGAQPDQRFAVLLDPSWLPLLSESMLGEPIELNEPGADDLLSELTAQAYGTLRTQLASAGVTLPETTFEVLPSNSPLPGNDLTGALLRIDFELQANGRTFDGLALLPDLRSEEPPQPQDGFQAADPAARPETQAGAVDVAPAAFPELGEEMIGSDEENSSFSLLAEVDLEVTVELGRRKIPLSDVLRLTTGSVIELEKLVGEPLEIYANGRLIAEGEAIVIDEQFGVRVTNLVSSRQRTKAFL